MKRTLPLPILSLIVAFLSLPLLVSIVPTGCTTTNGTNTFDVAKAAKGINTTLGPVVVLVENLDPSTVKPFQEASAALGVLLSNNATDLAALQNALSGISDNAYVKFAISQAVNLYSQYIADAVSEGLNKNEVATVLIRDGFKAALDQGIKAQKARVKAGRRAVRL